MVLASHVHPSVATMARTILSGLNIVYDGNPLNDFSLSAFLDKFMEKKPKPSMWHGGSQIEPAKEVSLPNVAYSGLELFSGRNLLCKTIRCLCIFSNNIYAPD